MKGLIAILVLVLIGEPSIAQQPAEILRAQIQNATQVLPNFPAELQEQPIPGERSGVLAGVLSAFVFPGVGSYYAGNNGHGTTHLLTGLVTLGGMIAGLAAACDDGFNFCDEESAGFYVAGFSALGYAVNWVWSIFTATGDVRAYNQRLRESMAVSPPVGPRPVAAPADPGRTANVQIQVSANGPWHQAQLLSDGRVRIRGELRVRPGDVILLLTPDHEAAVSYVVAHRTVENTDPWTAWTVLTLEEN